MSTQDTLHLVAIGLTVLAVGVHPGWRRRACVPELVAATFMLAAMGDVALVHSLSVVVWIPLLIAAAMALAAFRSVRRRAGQPSTGTGLCATTHDPLGLIATAAILPYMHGATASVSEHEHGGHGDIWMALILLVAAGHILGSLVAGVHAEGRPGRIQFTAMGGATLFMALALVA